MVGQTDGWTDNENLYSLDWRYVMAGRAVNNQNRTNINVFKILLMFNDLRTT